VVEERGGAAVLGGGMVRLAAEEGGDALAIEDAQFDGAGRHRFDADGVEAAIGAQNTKTGAEPLFGCGRLASTALIKPSVFGPILPGPAAEPIRRPIGVAPVGTGHMVGVRAVLAAHVPALVGPDALAAMEARSCAR
jgi:hypothetical protein